MLLVRPSGVAAAYEKSSGCVGVARIGSSTQRIVYGSLEELLTVDFGPPLHSLVIVGDLHELELEFLKLYKLTPDTPRLLLPDPDDSE